MTAPSPLAARLRAVREARGQSREVVGQLLNLGDGRVAGYSRVVNWELGRTQDVPNQWVSAVMAYLGEEALAEVRDARPGLYTVDRPSILDSELHSLRDRVSTLEAIVRRHQIIEECRSVIEDQHRQIVDQHREMESLLLAPTAVPDH